MILSVEELDRTIEYTYFSRAAAVGSVGYAAFYPTPLAVITAIALSTLALAEQFAKLTDPKSMTQYVVTKLAATIGLALISAVVFQLLFSLPVTAASVCVHAAWIILPSLVITGLQSMLLSHFFCEVTMTSAKFIELMQSGQPLGYQKITVIGDVTLDKIDHLKELPDHLTIRGNLKIEQCYHLASLGNSLTVEGNLDCHCSMSSVTVGNHLRVTGEVDFGNTCLTAIGDHCSMGGGFMGTSVGLATIGICFKVGGRLILSSRRLTSIGDGLSVGGSVHIDHCSKLTSLPKEMSAEGLYVTSCKNLVSLPEGMRIALDLVISGCPYLTTVPNRALIGRNIEFSSCMRLTELPAWVTGLGATSDKRVRKVHLGLKNLSIPTLRRLIGGWAEGVEVTWPGDLAYECFPKAEQVPEDVDWRCPISFIDFLTDLDRETHQPVLYEGRIYNFSDFIEYYNDKGISPFSRQPVVIKKLRRVDLPQRVVTRA